MQVPVVVEQIQNNGYRARSGAPVHADREGPTADLAVRKLEEMLEDCLKKSNQVFTVELPEKKAHPWLPMAGMYENDPLFDEWQQIIAERRRLDDACQESP